MSRFRILDIDGADNNDADGAPKGDLPSKPCVEVGCPGTMYLYEPMDNPPAPTHFEFPRTAVWVCADDRSHTKVISLAEYSVERRNWLTRPSG